MSEEQPCPNAERHEEGPAGYIAWHNWAQGMGRTHVQSRCTGCNLWVIWTPRVVRSGQA